MFLAWGGLEVEATASGANVLRTTAIMGSHPAHCSFSTLSPWFHLYLAITQEAAEGMDGMEWMEWYQTDGNHAFDVFDTIPLIPFQPLLWEPTSPIKVDSAACKYTKRTPQKIYILKNYTVLYTESKQQLWWHYLIKKVVLLSEL